MRLLHGAAVATAALLLGAVSARAQSLSDAAAKEKERRRNVAKPAKVVTDEDLRSGGGTVSNPAASDTTAAASGDAKPGEGQPGKEGAAAKKEKTDDELKAEAQGAWRKKLEAANTELSQAQSLVSQIQAELNDTSGGVYTPRRAGLTTQLEDARKKQADAEQKVAALMEEGRRNGWR
jgi:hypothetical protein